MRTLWSEGSVLLMLIIHSLILVWSSTWQSPTLNEPGQLASGVAIWELGRFDAYRVNPPLVRAVAAAPVILAGCKTDWHRLAYGPGVRSEFDIGIDFVNANGIDSIRLFNLARWACIPFSFLGGLSCFLWGRALCGNIAGLVACGLWCFSPNILAYGQVIAPDVAGTSLMLLASYCFWLWLKQRSWGSAAAAGVALGLGLLARSSWVILFAVWPLIWCLRRIAAWRIGSAETSGLKGAGQLCSIMIIALYLLNLGNLFDGTMTRLGDFEFVSKTMGGAHPGEPYGNVFKGRWLAKVPVPLPKEFVLGIDHQKKDFEDFPLPSYLHGEWRKTGWWYYYLYGLAIKVPIGTLCLLLLAVFASAVRWRSANLENVTGWATLSLPGLMVFVMASCQPTLNHHFRYILPLFGPMFVLAATTPFAVEPCGQIVRWGFYALSGICIASALFSCATAAPRFISYFNALGGGARGGHRHMIHSSLDWGQDLYYLKQWINDHSIDEPIYLAYHGLFDPSAIGISYTPGPCGPIWDNRSPPPRGTRGLYAVSINYVMGDTWRLAPDCDYRFLECETPIHICGDTILVYRLR
jgi:Dolichyl-phosphate-mannose-protein mannosyltransferase